MSKTLSNILTVFKIVRILAKIVFVLCIVGVVCCSLAFLVLPMAESVVGEELFAETGVDFSVTYAVLAVAIVSCIGEAIFAFWAERYCKGVLAVGTPFTFDGAKECFRLGVASLIISLAVSIVSAIISAVVLAMLAISGGSGFETEFGSSFTLSTGLCLMFISLLFKHGAEQQKTLSEEATKDEDMSQT